MVKQRIDRDRGERERGGEIRGDGTELSRTRFHLVDHELRNHPFLWKSSQEQLIHDLRCFSVGLVIHPDNRWYKMWMKFILIWAIYSSFFTPMEFGFFRGLPENLKVMDMASQLAFIIDIILKFFVAYRDYQTYHMVYKHTHIALRYLKSYFLIDLLGCLPWALLYEVCGHREEVRFLLWIRLSRVRAISKFFHKLEKDTRVNYLFTRIVKLLVVELYCSHVAACIFYYLATTLPPSEAEYTWIGSLQMGDYVYSHFREIGIWKRYITSLYFAIVTMTTVGYGDIHAVNLREMIFIMIFVSFDMILGAYLIGNMTALIVKGSKTETFRDKMTDLIKFLHRNRLGRDIRAQIKRHFRLQYETSYTEPTVLEDIPISIRAKISQALYLPCIEQIPLFQGCSSEFIYQIVTRLHEEFFLPGEVIIEQGSVVDQLYFICHGVLENIGSGEGLEESMSLLYPNNSFGEISILCNIPHPYTIQVRELCRLLRIDKQSFSNILHTYFSDGNKILNNLLEGKESSLRDKHLESSDIMFHIRKQEDELISRVNSAAYHGNIYELKNLVRAGANPNRCDYGGLSPLHLASSRGYEDIVLFLLQQGVDVNPKDGIGNTPLVEALKNGHHQVISLLVEEGALLNVDDTRNLIWTTIADGNSDFLLKIFSHDFHVNTKGYDYETPFPVSVSEGLYDGAKSLLDRVQNLIKLLEDAKINKTCSHPEDGSAIACKFDQAATAAGLIEKEMRHLADGA